MDNFCEQFGTTVGQYYGKEKITDSLDLSSIIALPEGLNPVIDDSQYLSSLTTIPETFRLYGYHHT